MKIDDLCVCLLILVGAETVLLAHIYGWVDKEEAVHEQILQRQDMLMKNLQEIKHQVAQVSCP